MGCCVSSHRASSASKKPRQPNKEEASSAFNGEEETVKEVLSETPSSKPHLPTNVDAEEPQIKKNAPMLKPRPSSFSKNEEPFVPKWKTSSFKTEDDEIKSENRNNTEALSEEISQVSELCSLCETASTTTVTDYMEVRQRIDRTPPKLRRNQHFSGEIPRSRENRNVGISPLKRSDPSPGRARVGFGSSTRREVREFTPSRDGSGSGDMGEVSRRRSRSPATTRANNGVPRSGRGTISRSPSTRKTGRSPGRIPLLNAAQFSSRRGEEEGSREDCAAAAAATTTEESLENPLVSLECFIFL